MTVEAPLPAIEGLPTNPEMPAGARGASAIEVIKQHPLQPVLGRPIDLLPEARQLASLGKLPPPNVCHTDTLPSVTNHSERAQLRLVVPFPTWDDLLRLAFDEICAYGATSVQVMRRMNALVADLSLAVPEELRPKVKHWDGRLKATIARSFADSELRKEALEEDRQGLGVPRHHTQGGI